MDLEEGDPIQRRGLDRRLLVEASVDLQINRTTPVERVHLHYDGRSEVEILGLGRATVVGVDGVLDAPDRSSDSGGLNTSTSWVDLRRGFLKDPETVLEQVLRDTPWAQGETWRYERYVPEQRLGAVIRNDGKSPVLRQTEMHLRSAYASPLAGVAAILYRDGTDFQGLHADRSMKWLDQTLIAILVIGERRPFQLRPRRPLSKAQVKELERSGQADLEDVVLHPGHGDLVVMGGRCQRDWLHGVPACDVQGARISVTWRWTARTGRPDTGPAYGEGVHYSDATERPFRRTRRV